MPTAKVETKSMPTSNIAQRINKKIRKNIKISELHIKDISGGCGQSFQVIVVSKQFGKIPLLAR